jgi:hypothetical protein
MNRFFPSFKAMLKNEIETATATSETILVELLTSEIEISDFETIRLNKEFIERSFSQSQNVNRYFFTR